MPTYLYIDELRTDTEQKRYRNEYELRHADYELSRAVNLKGEVTSDVMGGRIRVVIDGFGDEDLFNWLFDAAKRRSGEVVTTDAHEKVIEKFSFADARAVKYRIHFDANTKDAVSVVLVIDAVRITAENELLRKRG